MHLSNNSVQRTGCDFDTVPELPELMWTAAEFREHLRCGAAERWRATPRRPAHARACCSGAHDGRDVWSEALAPQLFSLILRTLMATRHLMQHREARAGRTAACGLDAAHVAVRPRREASSGWALTCWSTLTCACGCWRST